MWQDKFVIFVAVIIFIIIPVSIPITNYASVSETTGTLTSTYVDGGMTYLVVTWDDQSPPTKPGQTKFLKESLRNDDNVLFWKFNSGDVLANATIGKHYWFKLNWWRVPFMSWFRNIIEMKEIE